MAPLGKLYSYIPNARVLKVQAVARLGGVEIDIVPDFQMGVTNKTPDFLEKFPAGKVPAFEAVDGACIADSDAIAQYVAESGSQATELLGSGAAEKASVRQWICFSESDVMAHIISLVLWRVGYMPYNEQTEKSGVDSIAKALTAMEKRLEKRDWIALDHLSLADVTLASALYWGFMHIIDKEMRAQFPRSVQWYTRTIESEQIKDIFGAPNLIDVRKTPQA